MFGYVKPFVPELKMKEYDAFRAVYCGLCHQMGKSFSAVQRLTLNYDFVFLAMLHFSCSDTLPTVIRGRCCVNPLQRVPLCLPAPSLEFSADIAVLMTYYKLLDNCKDAASPVVHVWNAAAKLAGSSWKKAAARRPLEDRILAGMIQKQSAVEQDSVSGLDAACEPTASALSAIAAAMLPQGDSRRSQLEKLGYHLGRYIYLCDALDDLRKDLKTGNYNPLVKRFGLNMQDLGSLPQAYDYARDALLLTIGELGRISEMLPYHAFEPVIRNVIDDGLRETVSALLKKGRK